MDPIRINWQLITLTVVAGQALLFVLVLLLQNRGNRKANTCLGLVVLLLVWHHLDFIANTSFWYQEFPYLFTPHYVSWFLFGPLIYLYIRWTLDPGFRPSRRFYWAFLPAAISFVNYSGLYALDKTTKVQMIRDTVIRNLEDAQVYFVPAIPSDLIFTAQLVFLAGFMFLSFRELQTARAKSGVPESTLQLRKLRWLSFVVISFSLAALISNFWLRAIWLFSIFTTGRSVYLYVAPLTFLLLLLEVRAFLRPEVYTQSQAPWDPEPKYRNSGLGSQDEKAIISRLKAYLERHPAYLDSDIRISKLSKQLGIPVNHLSQAINHQLHQNFFELINSYRVAAARRMIDDAKSSDVNLLNIALDAGFNNKTTFLNAFKRTFHISPSVYRKSLQQHSSNR